MVLVLQQPVNGLSAGGMPAKIHYWDGLGLTTDFQYLSITALADPLFVSDTPITVGLVHCSFDGIGGESIPAAEGYLYGGCGSSPGSTDIFDCPTLSYLRVGVNMVATGNCTLHGLNQTMAIDITLLAPESTADWSAVVEFDVV
jgi:hypothetical protein